MIKVEHTRTYDVTDVLHCKNDVIIYLEIDAFAVNNKREARVASHLKCQPNKFNPLK